MTLDGMDASAAGCGYYGLRLHEPAPEPGFVFIPMLEEELAVWIATSSPLYTSEKFTPKDLECFEVPTWVALGHNGLEALHQELCEDYGVNIQYSPRYWISKADFFLNKVYAGDAVLLTAGSETSLPIRVREERGVRGFNPPLYATVYLVFKESDEDTAVNQFKEYVLAQFKKDPRATGSGA
jgi:DNA-binding transcriptional LysR family regulator